MGYSSYTLCLGQRKGGQIREMPHTEFYCNHFWSLIKRRWKLEKKRYNIGCSVSKYGLPSWHPPSFYMLFDVQIKGRGWADGVLLQCVCDFLTCRYFGHVLKQFIIVTFLGYMMFTFWNSLVKWCFVMRRLCCLLLHFGATSGVLTNY